MSKTKRTFGGDFKTFFVRGLAILLPSVLTLWIVVQAYLFVERSVAEPINAGIRKVVIATAPRFFDEQRLPEWFNVSADQVQRVKEERARQALRPLNERDIRNQVRDRNLREWWRAQWYARNIGLVVAIVLIYLAGRLLGGYIGRRIYLRLESYITRIPVFKQVYPYVKQVVEFLMGSGEQKLKFNRVVLVEYPRKGIWTVGLMTGRSMRDIESHADVECVTVFIPSSPTPFTGYTITVARNEAIDIPVTIDEALRFVVSGGVLVPARQQMPDDENPSIEEAAAGKGLAAASPRGMMPEKPRADEPKD
jgi:uncharacterized membrane protein